MLKENTELKTKYLVARDKIVQDKQYYARLEEENIRLKQRVSQLETTDNLPNFLESDYKILKLENENLKKALISSHKSVKTATMSLKICHDRQISIENTLVKANVNHTQTLERERRSCIEIIEKGSDELRLKEHLRYALRRIEIAFDLPIGEKQFETSCLIDRLNLVHDKLVFHHKKTKSVLSPSKAKTSRKSVTAKKKIVSTLKSQRKKKESAIYSLISPVKRKRASI